MKSLLPCALFFLGAYFLLDLLPQFGAGREAALPIVGQIPAYFAKLLWSGAAALVLPVVSVGRAGYSILRDVPYLVRQIQALEGKPAAARPKLRRKPQRRRK